MIGSDVWRVELEKMKKSTSRRLNRPTGASSPKAKDHGAGVNVETSSQTQRRKADQFLWYPTQPSILQVLHGNRFAPLR